VGGTGDPLSYNPLDGGLTTIRGYEIAGISPNLFDAIYYSIEPNYIQNYMLRSLSGFPFNGVSVRQDIGGRADNSVLISVEGQIPEFMNTAGAISGSPSTYPWQLTKASQLLTGWSPLAIIDYRFPTNFADCEVPVPPEFDQPNTRIPVPGRCLYGGRVGYSVKIVSRQYLTSPDLEFGGAGVKGPIRNPPTNDF
jgi:hypothetical protein